MTHLKWAPFRSKGNLDKREQVFRLFQAKKIVQSLYEVCKKWSIIFLPYLCPQRHMFKSNPYYFTYSHPSAVFVCILWTLHPLLLQYPLCLVVIYGSCFTLTCKVNVTWNCSKRIKQTTWSGADQGGATKGLVLPWNW